MEEQHPIPQQISAYQFRLVGDMTLKQFFQVAGGALVAIFIYSSSLPSYVKWPLIIFSFLFGIALAFFPLEDRPLAKWLVLFFKAIYSPTLYVWKKLEVKPEFFQPEIEEEKLVEPPTPTLVISNPKEPAPAGVEASPESTRLEKGEQEFLSTLTQQLTSVQETAPKVVTQGVVREKVLVPKEREVGVEHAEKPPIATEKEVLQEAQIPTKITPMEGQKATTTQAVQFSPQAAPPTLPTKANIIVGQVIDNDGNILDNTILEIRDSEGRAVRALKSNKLGHFMIVTPLADGHYEITSEKEGYSFKPLTIDLRGEIIAPIAIKANKLNS